MTGIFEGIARKLIWYFPCIVAALISVTVAHVFRADGYFVLLAITTIAVLSIVVHWSWTLFIGAQPWYQQDQDQQS